MDINHALFIRALKSGSNHRFKQIYKRIYGCEFDYRHGTMILKSISDAYDIMKSSDWIDGLNPDNKWKYCADPSTGYYEHCFKMLSSHIRLTSVHHLPGYPVPTKFKRV